MQPSLEGQVFYQEAMRTIAQSQLTIEATQRAARGEVGKLSIGFSGAARCSFLPEVIRSYKVKYPGLQLKLNDLSPIQHLKHLPQAELMLGL
jgi:DNA-binding transcriptional LysR family regulator